MCTVSDSFHLIKSFIILRNGEICKDISYKSIETYQKWIKGLLITYKVIKN